MSGASDPPVTPELGLEVDGGVARVTMRRPAKANALSRRQLDDLAAVAAWIDAEPAIKVVVIDGDGAHFSGGADLTDDGIDAVRPSRTAAIDHGRVVTTAIAGMRPVTIARLHGRVRGGGAVLAMACDLRFAILGTELSFPEAKLGWPLPWGCVPRLVREVGPMRAKDLVINSRPMSAEALAAAGLVVHVGDEADVDSMIDDTVRNLLATPSVVLEALKVYIDECAEALVPAALGRSDVWRMSAAIADPLAREVSKAGVQQLLAGAPLGPRPF